MAWADEIAEQNAILASNQKNLDWLQGNTATFHTGSSEEPIERTAAGAVGYMTAWRTDNPSVTEGPLFIKWNYWVNDVTIEGIDAPSGNKVSETHFYKNELFFEIFNFSYDSKHIPLWSAK